MRPIDCDGCVHLIPKTDECGLHRFGGRPAPIAQIERCRDYAASPPSVDRCLDALPKGLPESAGLDRAIMTRFIRLVLAHGAGHAPAFWFFSDPHYPEDEAAGRLDIVDYRGYKEIEGILEALGYRFSRPAGPVRDLALPPEERARFLREFGAYYALAVSALNRVRWDREQARARRVWSG
jgi:hypothetical protein